MAFLKRLVGKTHKAPSRPSPATTHCNYSNNYYGDQVCTQTKTMSA